MKKIPAILFLFCLLLSCKSASEKYVDTELKRTQALMNEIYSATQQCKKDVSAASIARLNKLCSDSDIDVRYGETVLDEEGIARLQKRQRDIDSLRLLAADLCQLFVKNCSKVLFDEDVLVETVKTYPVYLKKGTRLIVGYAPSGPLTAKLYNADSRALVKTYNSAVSDTVQIKFSAIYLFEIEAKTPEYAKVELLQAVNDIDEFSRRYRIDVEQIEVSAGSFRAKRVPGVDMKPIFEEPHKYTLRSKMKYFLDTSSPFRTVAALRVPAGTTDILYHLRVSSNDDGKSSDGRFFKDVDSKYKKIKFLGLPLYESNGNSSSLLRELLNGCTVQREENAYTNLYVFTNQTQAKRFQESVDIARLSYNMDYSASGTQSVNERIPAKGLQTIYLGFENTRLNHEVFLWLEAIAVVPKSVYYSERYSLAK